MPTSSPPETEIRMQAKKRRTRKIAWTLVGLTAGVALLTPRRWMTVNDVTTGGTPEYPEIEPHHYEQSVESVYRAAGNAIRRMARWKIISEDPAAWKIQAEIRTAVFGFTDDVTVWVEPQKSGCRVMIRSHSRVGRGDMGENARTIRALQREMDSALSKVVPGKQEAYLPNLPALPDSQSSAPAEAAGEVLHASEGAGPLLQRDYSGVIVGTDWTPERVMEMVTSDFARFSPSELALFTREGDASGCLAQDELMTVDICAAGRCQVRIVNVDMTSLTMRTLDGHPEAGRITFGSMGDPEGRLVFRIRSRARAADLPTYVGYELFGKGMQEKVWVTFVERVAEATGGKLLENVKVETEEVAENLADMGGLDTPTFVAGRPV
jgi:uncharacterized protein (DUF1499 family)